MIEKIEKLNKQHNHGQKIKKAINNDNKSSKV